MDLRQNLRSMTYFNKTEMAYDLTIEQTCNNFASIQTTLENASHFEMLDKMAEDGLLTAVEEKMVNKKMRYCYGSYIIYC